MPRISFDLDELEKELGEEQKEIVENIAIELVNQLKIEAPMGATGDLRRSFQSLYSRRGEIVVGSRLHYAEDVLKGTDPHMADFDKIQVWARRKLGYESAAGPVWRKIAREGTDPNDYVDRAIENTIERF